MAKRKRPWVPCPSCQHPHSEVVKVLTLAGRRQRRCLACRHDFLTRESLVGKSIPVSDSIIKAIDSIPRIDATRV